MNIYELYGRKVEECEQLGEALNASVNLLRELKAGIRNIDDVTVATELDTPIK